MFYIAVSFLSSYMKEKMAVLMHGFFHWSVSDHYSSFNEVGKKPSSTVGRERGKANRMAVN